VQGYDPRFGLNRAYEPSSPPSPSIYSRPEQPEAYHASAPLKESHDSSEPEIESVRLLDDSSGTTLGNLEYAESAKSTPGVYRYASESVTA
jgi:hypothetical protein